MSEQKQKIISDICPHHKEYGSCEKCREDDVFLDDEPCYYECMANQIIKNNYVKQSEGKWIDQYQGMYANQLYKCSVCGETAFHDDQRWFLTNYCPNCGARMKGCAE